MTPTVFCCQDKTTTTPPAGAAGRSMLGKGVTLPPSETPRQGWGPPPRKRILGMIITSGFF